MSFALAHESLAIAPEADPVSYTGKELKSTTLKSLTDLLNAVAPPIAEHEVIQVSLSHDMKGYDGVETLVYRGLSKVNATRFRPLPIES